MTPFEVKKRTLFQGKIDRNMSPSGVKNIIFCFKK